MVGEVRTIGRLRILADRSLAAGILGNDLFVDGAFAERATEGRSALVGLASHADGHGVGVVGHVGSYVGMGEALEVRQARSAGDGCALREELLNGELNSRGPRAAIRRSGVIKLLESLGRECDVCASDHRHTLRHTQTAQFRPLWK